MSNDDMDGIYFGGGSIEHAIQEGDIYLKASHVGQLLNQTGIRMALMAIRDNDPQSAITAQFIMVISEKILELRSELLKRELDSALPDLGELSFDNLFKDFED